MWYSENLLRQGTEIDQLSNICYRRCCVETLVCWQTWRRFTWQYLSPVTMKWLTMTIMRRAVKRTRRTWLNLGCTYKGLVNNTDNVNIDNRKLYCYRSCVVLLIFFHYVTGVKLPETLTEDAVDDEGFSHVVFRKFSKTRNRKWSTLQHALQYWICCVETMLENLVKIYLTAPSVFTRHDEMTATIMGWAVVRTQRTWWNLGCTYCTRISEQHRQCEHWRS